MSQRQLNPFDVLKHFVGTIKTMIETFDSIQKSAFLTIVGSSALLHCNPIIKVGIALYCPGFHEQTRKHLGHSFPASDE